MIKEKLIFWPVISSYIGKRLAKYLPFSAIHYTLMSFVIALCAIICAYQHYFVSTILLFLLANFFDIVDGAVARARNQASNLGAFLDGTVDRFIDFAMIYAYFYFPIKVPCLDIGKIIAIISFVVIMPTFIVAYANHRGAVDDDNETLIWRIMNRGELSILMMGIFVVSLFSATWAGYAMILLIALSLITILQTIVETIYYANRRSI